MEEQYVELCFSNLSVCSLSFRMCLNKNHCCKSEFTNKCYGLLLLFHPKSHCTSTPWVITNRLRRLLPTGDASASHRHVNFSSPCPGLSLAPHQLSPLPTSPPLGTWGRADSKSEALKPEAGENRGTASRSWRFVSVFPTLSKFLAIRGAQNLDE